jgi:tetratricopeptide (TPR) repeat protein
MKVELRRQTACLFLLIFLYPCAMLAQRSISNITVKEAAEISYKSELLVNELRDLMNVISNKGTNLKETKDLIYNSHSGAKNKIFYNATILVEDDLNPVQGASATPKETTIEKYLNDLDILYQKSDTFSISFENIRVSKIKQADYLYIKVYFNSIFKNKFVATDIPYPVNNRLAEIRIDKNDSKWMMQIMRLGFYKPDDTINDHKNDIALIYEDSSDAKEVLLTADNTQEEQLMAQAREKLMQEDNNKKEAFKKLTLQGDQYIKDGDYAAALKAFAEAEELNPYDRYPKIKILQINKLIDQTSVSDEEIYKQYIRKAQIAEKERKYEQAKEFYSLALAKKPMGSAAIEQNIRTLTERLRALTESEEKYQAGQYKEAIKDYDKAIRKDSRNSDLYLGRGKCYDKTGESGRALKDYTTAIDLDNNNLQALQLRAEIYAAKNDPFKALTDYKIYTTINKTDAAAFFRMCDLHLIANNLKSAIEDLDRIIAFDAKNSKAYYRKGLLLSRLKDHKGALHHFSTAIKADPFSPQAYYQRGLIQVEMNNIHAAGEDFATARRYGLDSASLRTIASIGWNYYTKGLNHFSKRSSDSSLYLFNTAIIIDPLVAEYRFRRGEYFYNQKKYDTAISNYTDAIQLNRVYYDALYKRGLARFNKEAFEASIPDFAAAAKLSPQIPVTYLKLADAYFRLQKYAAAIIHYEKALQAAKTDKHTIDGLLLADLYNNQGSSYFHTGDHNKALECFKNAVKADKNRGDAWFNRGHAYLQLSQLKEAEADILKALTWQPGNALWNYTLGEVYRRKQEFQEAVKYYSQAIATDKNGQVTTSAFYGRGISYYQLADFAHALPDYNASRKYITGRDLHHYRLELGTIYLQLGKSDSAQQSFYYVLINDSANVTAQYGIGAALAQKNQFDKAIPWFEKAFRSGNVKYGTIKRDKLIAGIKDDRQFKALIKKYF